MPTIAEVLAFKHSLDGKLPDLVVCEAHEKVGAAIELMQRYGISQLPVVRGRPPEALADVIGSLNERGLLDRVFRNPDALEEDVAAAMGPPLPAVAESDSVDEVFADLAGGGAAVVVVRDGRPTAVLTRSDLLEYLAHTRSEPLTRVALISDVHGNAVGLRTALDGHRAAAASTRSSRSATSARAGRSRRSASISFARRAR